MALISFKKHSRVLDVAHGSNLMKVLLESGIPVGSSCGGEGVCTKCLINIIRGANNLSPPNDREQVLRTQHKFADQMRVSCQTQVLGDIEIDADYW